MITLLQTMFWEILNCSLLIKCIKADGERGRHRHLHLCTICNHLKPWTFRKCGSSCYMKQVYATAAPVPHWLCICMTRQERVQRMMQLTLRNAWWWVTGRQCRLVCSQLWPWLKSFNNWDKMFLLTFMIPRGWIWIILVILWHFL